MVFAAIMDDIIKKCNQQTKLLFVEYKSLQRVAISACAFVDNVVIITRQKEDLLTILEGWKEILEKNRMRINKRKTKVMTVEERPELIKIQLGNSKIRYAILNN